jgi:hypothetical protein
MSNFIALDPGLNGAGAILDRHVEIHVSFDIPTIGEGVSRPNRLTRRACRSPGLKLVRG